MASKRYPAKTPKTPIAERLESESLLTPILDSVELDRFIDHYPELRLHPKYGKLRQDCDKYFKALQYRDALTSGEISLARIVTLVNATRDQVYGWLKRGTRPRLLWLLENERMKTYIIHRLRSKEASTPSSNEILYTADNPEFREQLLPPHTLTAASVKRLLNQFLKTRNSLVPTSFTHIADYSMYQQALRAFPLIQSHPRFDELHRRVKLYFLIINDPILSTREKLPYNALTEYLGFDASTIYDWIKGKTRPRLLTILESRATTLKLYQERVSRLRKLDKGITTIQDLKQRMTPDHFMLSHHLQTHPNRLQQLNSATRYLALLQLIEAGYHPLDLENHFKITRHFINDCLRNSYRPFLVRVAANIPETQPKPGFRWLPTITEGNVPLRYIQAPVTIKHYKELFNILQQLPSPAHPDSHLTQQLQDFGPSQILHQQWKEQFGKVHTIEEKLLAFGYIIGVALSDGCIVQKSTFSSRFTMGLSPKYGWSPAFGNRTAYYLTSLGLPAKPDPSLQQETTEKPSHNYYWISVTTPLLTWVNETVLGFKPGQTHTYTPAQINWILDAPRSFQIKVLQGLFDGDGWASVLTDDIGVYAEPNVDVIKQLLSCVGITSKQQRASLHMRTHETKRLAAKLPVFLSATGRFQRAQKIVEMIGSKRPTGKRIDNLPLIRRVLELGRDTSLSPNQIRLKIYEEYNITISAYSIGKILKQRENRLKIDYRVVHAYFRLLTLQRQNPDAPKYWLTRQVRKEFGVIRCINTLCEWLRGRIPSDVARALSDGYTIESTLLDAYPHLRQYLPS